MDKYIGRLLDNRYEILEVIGTGGMAVVYKARCHRLNRLVAIKILKDDFLEDEDFRSRFHTESQAVAMLSHPNIVSVYDVSTSISLEADYIVMELIEGISLKQYMEKKGFLNWKETLHFAIQIAKALQHAHSRGIVHRDIKPHNVMVLKNGSVKVTDFGIARMMSQGNTLTKEALGSVHYISPEQAKGGRVDDRSDIYSLGVVMYEMMSGRPPYDGDSPVAVAIQHINGGAPMPSTLNPNIPGGLEQIIMKAMANELGKRYSSAAEMLRDMDEFRKDPTMLFDYNTPPMDVLTGQRKEPQILEFKNEKNQAERVANRAKQSEQRPRTDAQRRKTERERAEQRRRREAEEERRNRIATIAIIACSLVAVIAIVIFLVVLLGSGSPPPVEEPITVPDLAGETYAELKRKYPDLNIVKDNEIFDDTVPAGAVISQDPVDGTKLEKGGTVAVVVSLGKAPKEMGDLTNYPVAQAREYLNSMKLDLWIKEEPEYHEEVEEGKLIRTEPVAGEQLTAGQTVVLVVSKGPETKTSAMPDVIDRTEEYAKKTLDNQKLHLKIEIEEIFDSTIEVGNVVRTEPDKGGELKTGQTVTLYISKGPELKTMPPLVGSNIDDARKALFSAGFTKAPVVEEVFSDKPVGVVVEQSVAAYTEADVTLEITLKVSKGAEPPTVITKSVTFSLPGDREADYEVEIRLGEETVQFVSVGAKQTEVMITVTGIGKQHYGLYIDGELHGDLQEVDFSA